MPHAKPFAPANHAPPTQTKNSDGKNTLQALLQQRADIWRGDALASTVHASIPSGFTALDAELPGGGWPVASTVELVSKGSDSAGHGGLSLLLPMLEKLTTHGRWATLIAPPHRLYAPAWLAAGINLERVFVTATQHSDDACWAAENCLRSGTVSAVLLWPGLVNFTVRKRLQLAAEEGGGTLFSFQPPAAAQQSTPAPLKLLVQGAQTDGLSVRILKRRGPGRNTPLQVLAPRPASTKNSRGKLSVRCEDPTTHFIHTPHALACPATARFTAGSPPRSYAA